MSFLNIIVRDDNIYVEVWQNTTCQTAVYDDWPDCLRGMAGWLKICNKVYIG